MPFMSYEVDSCLNSPSIEGTMFNTCDRVNSLAVFMCTGKQLVTAPHPERGRLGMIFG